MKIALLSFILSTSLLAQDEIQKYEAERDQIYSSLGEGQIIPKNAFDEAYKAYYTLKKDGRISSSPLITFVNYSIPSSRERMVVVDLSSSSVVLKAQVAHGKNSGGVASPATSFSNTDGSLQSSLGFYLTGEQYSGKHGTSLRLDGLSGNLNSNARSRAIVIHAAHYVSGGGRSYGCLALTPQINLKAINLLKGKTLIYGYTSSQFASLGDQNSAIQGALNKQFANVPSVDGVGSEFPEYSDLKKFEGASPSVSEVGITGVGGSEILSGSNQYEECQNLSNDTWENTVQWITSGKDPSVKFKGSWKQLNNQIVENEIDNDDAVTRSKERLAKINDCVALAHISKRTNFNKANINKPETRKSVDGSIVCKYEGPQSQDYQDCLKSIAIYDGVEARESEIHEEQKTDFKTIGASAIAGLGGATTQTDSVNIQKGLNSKLSEISTARAQIGQEKINALYSVAKKIPTTNTLYQECEDGFKKHGTVGLGDFKEIVRLYSNNSPEYDLKKNHCAYTVKTEANQIQNTEARNSINSILMKYGKAVISDNENANSALDNITSQGELSDSQGIDVKGAVRNITGQIKNKDSVSFRETGFEGSVMSDDDIESGFSLENSAKNPSFGSASSRGTRESKNTNFATNEALGLSETSSDNNDSSEARSNSDTQYVSSQRSQLYDPKFYEKIELALSNPSRVSELNLSPEQHREFKMRMEYKESLKRETSSAVRGDSKNINSKDKSIFEIISNKYMQRTARGDL